MSPHLGMQTAIQGLRSLNGLRQTESEMLLTPLNKLKGRRWSSTIGVATSSHPASAHVLAAAAATLSPRRAT